MKIQHINSRKTIVSWMTLMFCVSIMAAVHAAAQSADVPADKPSPENTPERQDALKQLQAIRAARLAVAKQTQYEEARLAELQGSQVPPLLDRYRVALKQAIQKNWKTRNVPQPYKCYVEFTQIPGGEVISVTFLDCPANKKARNSIEVALREKPLPYFGYEQAFQKRLAMVLCHPEKSCN